ncbi:hypothetical protein [Streptomyces sp. NPDC052225]|uniref:hypothetical protein n=1 Tax=Streptomyces sp. NPDC052225 TaxID=3154949 RepID=UPI00343080D7
MGETRDGGQAGVEGPVRGRGAGEQEDPDRRMFLGVELVLAVVPGDLVRLDLDAPVRASAR